MSDQETTGQQQQQAQGSTSTDDRIPYSRFQEVLTERNAYKSQVEGFQSKLDAEVQSRLEKLKSELESGWHAEKSAWQEERALLQHGLTDGEAMDAARFAWSRVAQDQRPEGGIGEWLSSVKANPEIMPKILSPFFMPVEPTKSETTRPPAPAAPIGRPAVSTGPVTAEALRAAGEKMRRTGDRTEFDLLKKALRAEQGR